MPSQHDTESTPLLGDQQRATEPIVSDQVGQDHDTGENLKRQTSSIISTGHYDIPEVGTAAAEVELGQEQDNDDGAPLERQKSYYLIDISNFRFRVIMGGVLFQYFVATFDSTLMASSHPVITSYFNASNAASWLSTAFLLTSTAFQPLFGRISDTFGRRPLYLFSLTVFALATVWCAAAGSITSFIAARAACGLGAGGVMSMVCTFQALLRTVSNGHRARSW